MRHDFIKTGDPDVFPAITDRNGEVVLGYCRRCGQAEAELAPGCPGLTAAAVTDDMINALWRDACGQGPHRMADTDTMHTCTVAVNHYGDFTAGEQDAAKREVAEILNARAAKSEASK